MLFQPVLPIGGLAGWVLLNNTLDRQTETFNKDPLLTRDTAYFEETIASIKTAEDLVSDRRLLRVALGAFGLQDDLDSRALIRTVLEEGTTEDDALANRLADERYKQLSNAFGFGSEEGPRIADSGFAADITARFRRREFEVAVGDQDQAMRIALNAQRELVEIAAKDEDEDTLWLHIMGTPPLRQLFEVALGLPSSFVQQDLDRQLEVFKDRAASRLDVNSITDLTDGDLRDKVIRRYLLQDQVQQFTVQSSGSIALTLLQSGQVRF